MNSWVIFHKPKDHVRGYVARKFILDKPTRESFYAFDYEGVLDWVKKETAKHGNPEPVCFPRCPDDAPMIVEVWI
jgi:hypothetical protein